MGPWQYRLTRTQLAIALGVGLSAFLLWRGITERIKNNLQRDTWSRKPTTPSLPLSDGHAVPWIAYGTGTALYNSDASTAVSLALTTGFTHLDCAQMYKNEDSLGQGLIASKVPRSSVFITTKLAALDPKDPGGVEGTLKESLSKLGVDYVDLFLVHTPKQHSQYEGRLGEVWKEMVQVKKKGLTKSIGVSNFNVNHLEEIEKTGLEMPVVNQIEYHLFLSSHPTIRTLLSYHDTHKIITASYGGLTPILPNRSGPSTLEPAREALKAALDKARAKRGEEVTQNQIVLKWLQQSDVLAVTTSSKESRLKEYLSVTSLSDLTAEEIKEIEAPCEGIYYRNFPSVWQE